MIGSITSATGADPTPRAGLGALDGEAFLQLLVAQLRYQNPLAPSDPSTMLQQSAQFTQVETLQRVATTQAELAGLQQVNLAAQLVGKHVSALGGDGAAVTGVVDAVRFTDQGPLLRLGDIEVPLATVSAVSTAPNNSA